jgi:iron complex transport system permease protein
MNSHRTWRILAWAGLLLLLLAASSLTALCLGSTLISPAQVLAALGGHAHGSITGALVVDLRLPRLFLAILAGAALSVGGLVFQALLRNPLAEPYVLGVSGGAAIGGIGALLLGFGGMALRLPASFCGGILTLLAVLAVGKRLRASGRNTLLLAGVILNAFCGALILFLISMTPQHALASVVYWLMGGLSYNAPVDALALAGATLPCMAVVALLAHRMNVLQLGEDTAQTMGVRVAAVRHALLWATTIMVSATVAICGPLGFIGLVVPHALRSLFGADHRILVPACALGGGAYLALCDALARTLPATGELPVGVVTAMIGAPIFIALLTRRAS